jgi:RNA polymerase sigma-70 factor (ECF subfamily)
MEVGPMQVMEETRLASELREDALRSIDMELEEAPASDNSLVREFISGNDAAFTQIVSRYKDPITNYLNMMVGDYDIAVDLSQETFLRVYRNIDRYSNLYQFSTWIYRIATNLAIDEMRYR